MTPDQSRGVKATGVSLALPIDPEIRPQSARFGWSMSGTPLVDIGSSGVERVLNGALPSYNLYSAYGTQGLWPKSRLGRRWLLLRCCFGQSAGGTVDCGHFYCPVEVRLLLPFRDHTPRLPDIVLVLREDGTAWLAATDIAIFWAARRWYHVKGWYHAFGTRHDLLAYSWYSG